MKTKEQMNTKAIEQMNLLERAAFFKELKEEKGMSVEEIADEFNVCKPLVYGGIRLANEPKKVRDFVERGTVTPAEVLQVVRKKMTTEEKLQAIREFAKNRKSKVKALGETGTKMTIPRRVSILIDEIKGGKLKGERAKVTLNILEKIKDANVTIEELVEEVKA